MELNQLKYFQKVAQVGSVTRAAEELFISQSTLSQCLTRLEESIGCHLFYHLPGKPMRLNEAGEAFLEVVDQVLQDLEFGVNRVRTLASRGDMQVSIASSVYDLCNQILLDFFTKRTDVKISQRMTAVNSLTNLLLNNEADFAISPCPLTDERLDCRTLYMEESLAAVGPTHPLYGKKYIDLQELRNGKFICNYAEADRFFLEWLFSGDGAEVIMESNEPGTIRSMIEQGIGIGFMPARIVMRRVLNGESPDQFVRVRGFDFSVPTCISKKRKRYLTREASELYEYIIEYCDEESRQVESFMQKYYGD